MLNNLVDIADLERVSDAIFSDDASFGTDIVEAAKKAIRREFTEIENTVEDEHSESTLRERKMTLEKLAPHANIGGATLRTAFELINERILLLEREAEEADAPSLLTGRNMETDNFDDRALMNLFAPLLSRS